MSDVQSSSLYHATYDVGFSGEPFLVYLDKEAGDESHERVDVGEDCDLPCSSLQLLDIDSLAKSLLY